LFERKLFKSFFQVNGSVWKRYQHSSDGNYLKGHSCTEWYRISCFSKKFNISHFHLNY